MTLRVGRPRAATGRALILAAAAVSLGALIAWLPPHISLAALAGVLAVGAAVWEPALGLGLAVILGPTRAYLAASGFSGPVFDLGQIFFALALAGWLARGALRRELRVPALGLLVPLAAWIFVGLLSLFGAAEWRDGLNEAIKWIEVALVLIIAQAEARRGRLTWLLGAILFSGGLQAALGVWQYRFRGTGPESFQLPGGFYRAYGTFEQPNPLGGFLGLIWPVAAGLAWGLFEQAWRRWRTTGFHWTRLREAGPALALALWAGGLGLGLFVSYSRGGWLGAAAAAGVLAVGAPRRLRVGLGLALAGLALVGLLTAANLLPASLTARLANVTDFATVTDVRGLNINDANFALVERLAHWQAALAMAEARPWLGVGLGNYAAAYADYRLLNWPYSLGHAHNIYLHTLAETGGVGLAAYGTLWLAVVILTLRAVQTTSGPRRGLAVGLLGVWAHLLTHQIVDNLHVNNVDLLLATYLGILYALNSSREPVFGQAPDSRAPAAGGAQALH